jgi:hypothetical protein
MKNGSEENKQSMRYVRDFRTLVLFNLLVVIGCTNVLDFCKFSISTQNEKFNDN